MNSYFTSRHFLGVLLSFSLPHFFLRFLPNKPGRQSARYCLPCADETKTQRGSFTQGHPVREEAKPVFMILGASYFVSFKSSFKDGGRISPNWKPQLLYQGESKGQTWATDCRTPGCGSLNK